MTQNLKIGSSYFFDGHGVPDTDSRFIRAVRRTFLEPMPLWSPTSYGGSLGYYGGRALGAAAGAAGAVVANRIANSAIGRVTGPQVAGAFIRNSPAALLYRGARAFMRRRSGGIAPWSIRSATGPLNMNDVQVTVAPLNTTAGSTLLNGIVPGDLINQRHNRKILMKYVTLRLQVIPDSAALLNSFRVALIYDKQANGTVPAYLDVFSDQGGATAIDGTLATMMPRNPANLDRFDVLLDWRGTTQGTQTNYAGPKIRQVRDFKINLKNRETRYNQGVGGTIADIQTGSLFLIWQGDVLSSGADAAISAFCRVHFSP